MIDIVFVCFIIYFWPCWAFVAAHGLSLDAASRASSLVTVRAFHCGGFSCGRAQAQQLWHTVLAAPRLVGSSRTRDRIRGGFLSTRKVPGFNILKRIRSQQLGHCCTLAVSLQMP